MTDIVDAHRDLIDRQQAGPRREGRADCRGSAERAGTLPDTPSMWGDEKVARHHHQAETRG